MLRSDQDKRCPTGTAQDRLSEIHSILQEAVATIVSGEDWKRYLDFQASLHSYSSNNVMLIFSQHAKNYENGVVPEPSPTYVASYGAWQALGRRVMKGQHGYRILAPCRYKERLAIDGSGESRRLRQRNNELRDDETIKEIHVVKGFKVEFVFDVSQTAGNPVPTPPHPVLLEGDAPRGLGTSILSLIEKEGYEVSTISGPLGLGGANGMTLVRDKMVLLREDLDDAQMVKTLIHEAAHILLHASAPGMDMPRYLQEVEAESVAFVVAKAHGMSSDDYSFPYVATWAGEDAISAVQSTQRRVAETAKALISISPEPHGSGGRVPRITPDVLPIPDKSIEMEIN